MLIKRIISSVVLIGIVTATIFVDWFFNLAILLFIIGGLYEFFTMLEHKGITIFKYFGIAMGAIIPLSIIFRFEFTKSWELFCIVLGILFLILMQFRRRQNSGVVVGISTTIFGILYVAWFLSFLIKIKYLALGRILLAALLLITKSGDIGAYLIGSRYGKTPLMPHISPKKTVEGAIGGLMFSVLSAIACLQPIKFSLLHAVFVGLGLSLLGQLGDLSESLMKRDCQVKDSSRIFPGMGGILDSIDSILFTAPVFYFYINTILK